MDTASNSSIALSALRVDDSENVVSASIRQVWYNSNGSWSVARGSNNIMSLFNSGHWNLAGHGVTLTQYSNATIGYTLAGTGTIILELQKSSAANT
jgi:hypothetical protein